MTVTANDQLRIKGHKKVSPREALAIPRGRGEGKAKQTFKDPAQSLRLGRGLPQRTRDECSQ